MKTSPPRFSEIEWIEQPTHNVLSVWFNWQNSKKRIAIHEAGHILVGVKGPEQRELDYSKIWPLNLGGQTLFADTEREDTAADIPILYAGTAAELLVYGNAYDNSPLRDDLNDFSRANFVAKKHILKPHSLGNLKDYVGFLGAFSSPIITPEMLPEGMSKIDALNKITDLKNDAFGTAWNILAENRTALEQIADLLAKNRRITGAEVHQILENEL